METVHQSFHLVIIPFCRVVAPTADRQADFPSPQIHYLRILRSLLIDTTNWGKQLPFLMLHLIVVPGHVSPDKQHDMSTTPHCGKRLSKTPPYVLNIVEAMFVVYRLIRPDLGICYDSKVSIYVFASISSYHSRPRP